MSEREEWLLELAADRAAQRPDYLGWVLSQYLSSEGISPTALVAELGCSEAEMRRLALCLRPRSSRFADDIVAIASKLGVDGIALARMVRRAEAVEELAGRGVVERGTLMAARRRRATNPEKDEDGPSR